MVGTTPVRIQILTPPFSTDSSPVAKTPADGSEDDKLLPAVFCIGHTRLHWDSGFDMNEPRNTSVLRPKTRFEAVLKNELLLPGLNHVHHYLWWCRPRTAPALALHEQIMAKRAVVVTERIGLHLICPEARTFVKPLSPFLLDYGFWSRHLCHDVELYGCAAGFLLSYVWLIRHRSDFAMAKELHLLPSNLVWDEWTVFVSSILLYFEQNPKVCINKRYQYGEIQLPRLNAVYRYAPETRWLHYYSGYLLGYGQFNSFWRRNFAWMGLGFLYMTAILTAMQVGLAVPYLEGNAKFQRASYGFAIFCIFVPTAVMGRLVLVHMSWILRFSFGWMRKWTTVEVTA